MVEASPQQTKHEGARSKAGDHYNTLNCLLSRFLASLIPEFLNYLMKRKREFYPIPTPTTYPLLSSQYISYQSREGWELAANYILFQEEGVL